MPVATEASRNIPHGAQSSAGTSAIVTIAGPTLVHAGDISKFFARASAAHGHLSLGQRLLYAVASVLGHGAVMGYKILSVSVDLLQFVPVPGLQAVGATLLRIYEVYKEVSDDDHHWDQSLRECAMIVEFLRGVVLAAGERVREDLRSPTSNVIQALEDVYTAFKEHARQSRTHRVFNRKDTKARREKCEKNLKDTFAMFVATVPVHILKHTLDDRTQPHADEDRHPSHQIPPGLPRIPFRMPEPSIPSEKPCYECPVPQNSTPSKNEAAHVATSRSVPPTVATIPTGEEADEKQYRTHLKHEFHAGLNLPLWTPSPVELGAVGYLSKPQGQFVMLFNAFKPLESLGGHTSYITSLSEYGSIKQGNHKQNRFTAIHRGLHHAQDHLTLDWNMGYSDSRHPDAFNVQANQETAHLYTEKANHKYIKNLERPRLWLRDYADDIVRIYGHGHGITKADLIFVAGALDAREHALFVSHGQMQGQVTFGVHTHAKPGQAWGSFSASGEDTSKADTHDPEVALKLTSLALKVSTVKACHEKWDTVLITPLRPEVETKEVSKM